MIRRRDVLGGGLGAAALAILPPSGKVLAQANDLKLIDAHCHIFNADDLPVVEFIEKTILPEFKAFAKQPANIRAALRYFLLEIADWARGIAPDAGKEMDLLDKFRAGDARAFTSAEKLDRDRLLAGQLLEIIREIALGIRRSKFHGTGHFVPIELMGQLHKAANPDWFNGASGERNPYARENWWTGQDLANAIFFENGQLARALRWGLLFTRYRHELADTLANQLDGHARLLVPALIDYTHWLDDRHNVRLDDQVKVMGAIARRRDRPNGPRVHGYAPFCPLREALHRLGKGEPASALERVKRAVNEEGFLGVKLYPPMGFRALGNTPIVDGDFFPRARRRRLGITGIGRELDVSLRALYGWCEANEVPIMAHASHSNGPTEAARDRASPEYWANVFREFPKLRVLLAHFGDFDEGFATAERPRPRLSDTWEWKMAALMAQFPQSQIYADMSFFRAPILARGKENIRREVARMISSVAQAHPGFLQSRLVFGSDWIMLGFSEDFAERGQYGAYAEKQRTFLAGIKAADGTRIFSASALEDMAWRNGARLLGLGRSGASGNRRRLDAFYAGHPARDWLTAYDSV